MFLKIWKWIREKLSAPPKMPSLIVGANLAKQEWLYAQKLYQTVTEPELIDYASYLIKAYEAQYTFLLRKIKQEGLQYIPPILDVEQEWWQAGNE